MLGPCLSGPSDAKQLPSILPRIFPEPRLNVYGKRTRNPAILILCFRLPSKPLYRLRDRRWSLVVDLPRGFPFPHVLCQLGHYRHMEGLAEALSIIAPLAVDRISVKSPPNSRANYSVDDNGTTVFKAWLLVEAPRLDIDWGPVDNESAGTTVISSPSPAFKAELFFPGRQPLSKQCYTPRIESLGLTVRSASVAVQNAASAGSTFFRF
ncbi:hypothetical protein LX36DRAFT_671332 [Colletotrichum falcatum]|nr:hypothetical protein LX36DRAFT_671332 [Colletotrichum falcatum]